MPSFDIPVAQPLTDPQLEMPIWPNLAWEKAVLEAARHPALPSVVENFVEDGCEYLVETSPAGVLLWDAWDHPDASAELRFGYLKQIAEGLRALHQAGAMLESLRPEIVVVADGSQAQIADLSELLPLPRQQPAV